MRLTEAFGLKSRMDNSNWLPNARENLMRFVGQQAIHRKAKESL
ncbi:hypothetical protein [Undibacterium parvum]|nr:hypothetical protein [Undibacterium parvum]